MYNKIIPFFFFYIIKCNSGNPRIGQKIVATRDNEALVFNPGSVRFCYIQGRHTLQEVTGYYETKILELFFKVKYPTYIKINAMLLMIVVPGITKL